LQAGRGLEYIPFPQPPCWRKINGMSLAEIKDQIAGMGVEDRLEGAALSFPTGYEWS
jgi:hypothetical protein